MVVHKRKVTRVNKKNVHKSVNRKSKKKTRNDKRYSKKIMRGGIFKFANEDELNMEEIGKYYDLHKYETMNLLVKKHDLTKLSEEDQQTYNNLPTSLEVSIDTKFDGSYRMTVKKSHLEDIIKKHAELSGKAIGAITKSIDPLKQTEARPLDRLALVPVVGIPGQVINRYATRVGKNMNVFDHTRAVSQKNLYANPNVVVNLPYGGLGVVMGEGLRHIINGLTSQPSNLVDRLATAIQEKYRDSILLNNEVITRYYDIKVDNEDRPILYIKEAFKAKSVLPEHLVPTSAGVDKKDGKFKIILNKNEYLQIEQIPHVRNLTDIHVLANLAALIPGKKKYYRGMDERSGVKIETLEGTHTPEALKKYNEHPARKVEKHLETKHEIPHPEH